MSKGKYILSLTGILFLVMLLVSGSSFAYWRWSSAVASKTNVMVSVTDGIEMRIEPAAASTNNLRPTNSCANGYAAKGTANISIKNNTGVIAKPTFKIKAKSSKALSTAAWAKIKWAIVEKNAACTETLATGTFSTGNFTSTLAVNTYGHTSNISGVTFDAAPNTTTTHQYDIWFWLDSTYTGSVNTGTTVADPMQNNTITVTWSEQSKVDQYG